MVMGPSEVWRSSRVRETEAGTAGCFVEGAIDLREGLSDDFLFSATILESS